MNNNFNLKINGNTFDMTGINGKGRMIWHCYNFSIRSVRPYWGESVIVYASNFDAKKITFLCKSDFETGIEISVPVNGYEVLL